MLAVSAIAGVMPVALAATFFVLISASLADVNRGISHSCPTPFDALRIATENLPDDIYRKASWRSPWLALIERGTFPKNTGVNQTTFVIGNTEPVLNAEGWTNLSLTANVISTMCSSSYTDVNVGYNEVNYIPRRFGIAGPIICKETLGFAHNPTQFLGQYLNEMTKRSKRSWELEFRTTYISLCTKAVCRTGTLEITQGTSLFPPYAAQSQLTWDYLDEAAQNLIQDGATDADMENIELGPDGPLFPIIIGLQAKQRLFTNVQVKRDDVHFAQEGMDNKNLLFRRLGATDTHKNYRMIPDVLPPRYTFANGIYTEVNTWEMVAASEGQVAQITAAYKNALYEGAIIFHPKAMLAEMVAPDDAGLDWMPTNYMGEWVWKTGGDISTTYCFDPLKKYGRHFAEFMYAPNPVFPNYGYTIIFKRCPNDITSAACAYA